MPLATDKTDPSAIFTFTENKRQGRPHQSEAACNMGRVLFQNIWNWCANRLKGAIKNISN